MNSMLCPSCAMEIFFDDDSAVDAYRAHINKWHTSNELRPLELQVDIRPHVGVTGNGRTERRRMVGISDRDI